MHALGALVSTTTPQSTMVRDTYYASAQPGLSMLQLGRTSNKEKGIKGGCLRRGQRYLQGMVPTGAYSTL